MEQGLLAIGSGYSTLGAQFDHSGVRLLDNPGPGSQAPIGLCILMQGDWF